MQGKIMIWTASRAFENVAQLKYVGMTNNQHLIEEEIKRKLNSGNGCCHSVQNHFVFPDV
jgi:hypothetical protein